MMHAFKQSQSTEMAHELGLMLREAVENGDYRRCESLILQGANVNAQSEQSKSTPLHVASWKPNERIASLLLRYGADPNVETHKDNRSTPTHFAAQCSSTFTLSQMIEHGANLHAQNNLGDTPMHCVAYTVSNHVNNLIALLDAGGDPDICNTDGKDVRAVAKAHGNGFIVEPILDHYASLPKLPESGIVTKAMLFAPQGEDGYCMLDNPSTWHRFDEVVRQLEVQGEHFSKADFLKMNVQGKTWLQRAAECRALPYVLQEIEASGESIGAKDLLLPSGESTPLLQGLIETATLPHALNAEHWLEGTRGLKQCYEALPERGKELIPNIHSLLAEVSRRDTRRQRGLERVL